MNATSTSNGGLLRWGIRLGGITLAVAILAVGASAHGIQAPSATPTYEKCVTSAPGSGRPASQDELVDAILHGRQLRGRRIAATAVRYAMSARIPPKADVFFEPSLIMRESLIIGDLNLIDVKSPVSLQIPDSVLEGNLTIGRASLMGTVQLDSINGALNVQNATIAALTIDCAQSVTLSESHFKGSVDFLGDYENFNVLNSRFSKPIDIGGSKIAGQMYVEESEFAASASLSATASQGVIIKYSTFADSVKIDTSDPSVQDIYYTKLSVLDSVFRGPVDLTLVEVDRLWMIDSRFHDLVDFTVARINHSLDLSDSTFAGEVVFFATTLPSKSAVVPNAPEGTTAGVTLYRTRFNSTLRLDWEQLVDHRPWWQFWRRPSLKLDSPFGPDFAMLRNAFTRSDNLKAKNETLYHERVEQERISNSISDRFSRVLWGYGYRPARLVWWICVVVALFSIVYWREAASIAASRKHDRINWNRLKFAVGFSLRTATSFTYGYAHSRTTFFRVVTTFQSLLTKTLIILLIDCLATVSPLLNRLLEGLLPA